ncbi:MAG: DMT family transporter [Clostridia bacterium]|nr:DMT family transporter [Clostridia bacterium]
MEEKNIFNKNLSFTLLAIAATALWGTAFPGIKLGYEWFGISDTGSKLLFAGIRFIIAGTMVLLVYIIRYKKFPVLQNKEIKPVLLLALIQVAGDYFFYYLGLSVTSGGVAAVVNSFDTFCAVIMVSLFFKNDKLTVQKIVGCIIGLTGIVLINIRGGSDISFKLTGEGFILISALFSTFGVIINKKAALEINPVMLTGYYLLIGGAILTAIAIPLKGHISFNNVKADLCLVYLSMVSALAFLIWSGLLKYNNVSKTSVFKLMTPIFGNVFSALALGENIFTPAHLISVLLVATGIGIVNYQKK